jgi:molybdopterin biosynthesis enzyme
MVAELDIRINVKGTGPGRSLLEAEGLLPIPENGGFRTGDEVEVWLL